MPARHPHARGGQSGAVAAEDLGGGAVGHHAAARLEHDRAGGQADDLLDPVLDDHGGGSGGASTSASTSADQRGTGRVEVRGGLVEQQQPGAQREDAGQRQPLLLAAGQRAGGGVPAVGEADGGQRLVDPRPDLGRRDAAVLQAERDVVAGPGHDQRGLGVLQHQPGAGPGLAGGRGRRGAPRPPARRRRRGRAGRPARPAGWTCRRRTGRGAAPARRARSAGRRRAAPRPAGRRAASPSRGRRRRPARRGVRVRPGPGRRRTGTATARRCGPAPAPAATSRRRRRRPR